MSEPEVGQMYLIHLGVEEFSAVMNVYGKYCEQIWLADDSLNISLQNVPLFLLGPIADTIQTATQPKEVGEPTV